jgi:glycerate-2-kinase
MGAPVVAAGVRATHILIDFVNGRGPCELLICLISGGGSALSPAPVKGITLAEKQEVTRLLLIIYGRGILCFGDVVKEGLGKAYR